MGYHMGVSGCFSKFCESSQNSRCVPMHMPVFPEMPIIIIFYCWFLGRGHLSQGKRRGKEKILSKKRVPTDRYVLLV